MTQLCPICHREMLKLDPKYYQELDGVSCDNGIHFSIYYEDMWRVTGTFDGKTNEIGNDYGTCYLGIGESYSVIPNIEFQDSWTYLLRYIKLRSFI